jgi:hypothetical protein
MEDTGEPKKTPTPFSGASRNFIGGVAERCVNLD